MDDLLTIEEAIEMDLRSLETSVYSNNTFHEILNKIQKAVDDLSLNAYRHNHIVGLVTFCYLQYLCYLFLFPVLANNTIMSFRGHLRLSEL